MFACRNPCGMFASCGALADTDATGVAVFNLPKPAVYFVLNRGYPQHLFADCFRYVQRLIQGVPTGALVQ